MSKIPVPIVIVLVVVAIAVLAFSMKKSGVVGSADKDVTPPTGPPTAAMQEYAKQVQKSKAFQGQNGGAPRPGGQ